ncbi:MAG: DUF3341 domain-containing protein [Deltaproteobacteria bacterium]|nr:DUF3341 domain-containing protein [Deltaproteobacteria bacterium]
MTHDHAHGHEHAAPAESEPLNEPIKAVYKHLDCLLEGINGLKQVGIRDFTVLSPIPRHEIEQEIYQGEPSPVRWFTLLGGIFGATATFSLASLTHANWPMIIPGGKPLVSIPPFLVVTFEGTILWGSLMTLVGLVLNCRLPAFDLPKAMHDPRFTNDSFGIVLERTSGHDEAEIKHILEHSGAIEVTGGDGNGGANHG